MQLDWPDCRNVRDVGGLPAAGGTVRTGVLVRSGHHAALTDAGHAAFAAYGVSRIIDLRRRSETERTPSPFAGDPRYLHVPVEGGAAGDGPSPTGDAAPTDDAAPTGDAARTGDTGLEQIYRAQLDGSAPAFAAALRAIVDAPPGATVVHCHAGKDRTGLVIALALDVVGVPPEEIASEYARTNADPRSRRAIADYVEAFDDPRAQERWRRLLGAPAAVMRASLEHLRVTYGGSRQYLESGGFMTKEQTALDARLVGNSSARNAPGAK